MGAAKNSRNFVNKTKLMCIIYHVDLQRYLPQIFGNMSHTILHEANNLNAKDERYISQGVYNMLFGTVELLTISAEEAKITEDSGLSAANRSQVSRNGSDQIFLFQREAALLSHHRTVGAVRCYH